MGQSLIIMYMRFAARYAPFQLFGTFMGLMATLMALPQMFFGTSLQNLMKRIYSEANDPRRFTVMFGILNGLTTLSMFSLVYHWYYFPPPAAGSVLMEKSEDGKPTLKIVKLASEKRNSTLWRRGTKKMTMELSSSWFQRSRHKSQYYHMKKRKSCIMDKRSRFTLSRYIGEKINFNFTVYNLFFFNYTQVIKIDSRNIFFKTRKFWLLNFLSSFLILFIHPHITVFVKA